MQEGRALRPRNFRDAIRKLEPVDVLGFPTRWYPLAQHELGDSFTGFPRNLANPAASPSLYFCTPYARDLFSIAFSFLLELGISTGGIKWQGDTTTGFGDNSERKCRRKSGTSKYRGSSTDAIAIAPTVFRMGLRLRTLPRGKIADPGKTTGERNTELR